MGWPGIYGNRLLDCDLYRAGERLNRLYSNDDSDKENIEKDVEEDEGAENIESQI